MARTYGYSTDFDEEVEMLFREAKFLGEGHNGIVYEVPGNKAIKIFQDTDICKQEAKILYRVKKSKYFPKIYKCGDYYILRQMVNGKRLDHYIKEKGLSSKLVRNIYNLIEEFESNYCTYKGPQGEVFSKIDGLLHANIAIIESIEIILSNYRDQVDLHYAELLKTEA